MALEHILLEKKDRVAYATLNRPDVLNALNGQLMSDLDAVIADVAADPAVGVLVLTGSGDKAFVAGADISELARQDPMSGTVTARRGQGILRRLETLGKPSIAAVNGFALGGGCELSMACTIRIASDKAKFGQPEVNLGIIPGYAGTQRLARIVGKGMALDLVLTGRIIDAAEALRIGLVSQVVAHGELMDAAKATADTLLAKGPLALAAAMEVIDRGFDLDFDDACILEATTFGVLCASSDMKEGLGAFMEKRKPDFRGK
ncbi:MAG: enoyl-CoA hydratase-related protein [Candidatus Krumholzibacteriia bacterium]